MAIRSNVQVTVESGPTKGPFIKVAGPFKASRITESATATPPVVIEVPKSQASKIGGDLLGVDVALQTYFRLSYGGTVKSAVFPWTQVTKTDGSVTIGCYAAPKPPPAVTPPSVVATFPPPPFIKSENLTNVAVTVHSKAASPTTTTPWMFPDKPTDSGSWTSVGNVLASSIIIQSRTDLNGRKVIGIEVLLSATISGFSTSKQYRVSFVYRNQTVTVYSHSQWNTASYGMLSCGLLKDDWTYVGLIGQAF